MSSVGDTTSTFLEALPFPAYSLSPISELDLRHLWKAPGAFERDRKKLTVGRFKRMDLHPMPHSNCGSCDRTDIVRRSEGNVARDNRQRACV